MQTDHTTAIIWIILIILFYFIPTLLAYQRKSINKVIILLINIFLGWTFIMWFVALIMAISGKTQKDIERDDAMIEIARSLKK